MKARGRVSRYGSLAAAALAVVVHALAALDHSFGAATDEAFHVRLAKAVLNGSFTLPGPFGAPITDPLPGYPLLISLPVQWLAPHWGSFRIIGLMATLAVAWLSWRLAERLLERRTAVFVSLVIAFSPTLVFQAGVVMPDAAYAALAVAGFLILALDKVDTVAFWALAAIGGLSAIVRPQGAILALSLALGYGVRRDARRGVALATLAFLPLTVWLARNRLAAGTATAYAQHWLSQAAAFDMEAFVTHAFAVVSEILGRGATGAVGPKVLAAAAGAVLLAVSVRGARRLLRGRRRPVAVALAAHIAATLTLQLTWSFALPRYALPLLAPLWILAAVGLETLTPTLRRAALCVGAFLAACALVSDARGLSGISVRPPAYRKLSAWIRSNLPAEARLESFACQPLELLAERPTECAVGVRVREAWRMHLAQAKIGWVHEMPPWRMDGYAPTGFERFSVERSRWLRDSARFERVFADSEEGALYRVKPFDEKRLSAACRAFERASAAVERGDVASARAPLEEAARLDPGFANAWALLALLEKDPRKGAALMRRAAEADPGSEDIRAELERLNSLAR